MRFSFRGESGIAMIEVMVSAVLLVALAAGTLPVLDLAQSTSASNRARSVAASLAKEDIGRLRALDPTTLANVRQTRTQPVGKTTYTIVSRADWVRESSGTVSCTSDTTGVDYIKVTSAVTWPGMRLARPVTAETLVSPPVGAFGAGRGTLAVKLQDAKSVGVPNMNVTAGSLSDATNQLGCAVFAQLAVGSTQVAFGQNGWVTPDGTTFVKQSATVVTGQTSLVSLQYDRGGTVPATFDTRDPVTNVVTPTTSTSLSASHSSLSSPRIFTPPAGGPASASSISASLLFPFTSPYTFFAGSCSGNNPALYDPNYFTNNPGLMQVGPGVTTPNVAVRLPTIQFPVRKYLFGTSGVSAPYNGAQVVVKADTSVTAMATCTTRYSFTLPATASTVSLPAVFGSYVLCASDGARYGTSKAVNTDPKGIVATGPIIPRSGPQVGTCP